MRKFSEVTEPLFTKVDCTSDTRNSDTRPLPRRAIGVVNVVPIQRATIAIYADYPGFIPGIGIAVGTLRCITGLALSILYIVGSCCSSNRERKLKYHVFACAAASEACRGIWEIVPFISIVPHMVCKNDFEYRNAQSPQVVGKINNMSHGNF